MQLSRHARRDSVTIALPAQFKVDEMPDPVQLDSAYGSYRASWKVDGDKLSFEQSLEIKRTLAPASEYASMRKFFDSVAGAQHASVVLLKQ